MTDSDSNATGQECYLAPANKPVFYVSAVSLVTIVVASAVAPESAEGLFSDVQAGIVANGSWYYVLVVAVILVSTFVIAATKYGDIKLGPDHAKPEYSLVSWFAMLFAAGRVPVKVTARSKDSVQTSVPAPKGTSR